MLKKSLTKINRSISNNITSPSNFNTKFYFSTSINNMTTIERHQDILENLNAVTKEIQSVCSALSNPTVRLVAVSKTKPSTDIEAAFSWGQRHFGENYVQELVEKSKNLSKEIKWHFIGSLQTNKCKALSGIPNLWAIETLTSIKQADALNDHRAKDQHSPINIFIQINTSQEESKSGLPPLSPELLDLCKHIQSNCPALTLKGLMTIGSIDHSAQSDSSSENPDFKSLVNCKSFVENALSGLKLELSMGMSMDYPAAILAGSTNVRVGSTIFGKREPKTVS